LTALQVKRAAPGVHTDGGNLYLRVGQDADGNVARQWTFRYTSPLHRVIDADGNVTNVDKRREAGLGNADKVSLAAAREQAARLRDAIALHRDPLDELRAADEGARARKQAEIAARRAERMRDRHTLRRVASDYHERVVEPHRSDKHAAQWISSIEMHVPATILDRPIEEIQAKELLDLLLSLRTTVRETGRRIAQRLGLIFADAKLRGLVSSNPISDIKPALRESKRDRQKSVKNFAALPFAEVPGLVRKLKETSAVASLALEFLIRTAARTGEVIGAKWIEVDLDVRIWTPNDGSRNAQRVLIVGVCGCPRSSALTISGKFMEMAMMRQSIDMPTLIGRKQSNDHEASTDIRLAPRPLTRVGNLHACWCCS